MKKIIIIFAILTFGLSFYFAFGIAQNVFSEKKITNKKIIYSDLGKIAEGDLIFQTSESSQCEAVRIATNSKFSHCGIVIIDNGSKKVLEAVQPVKITDLEDWITHGKDQKIVVKRLKNAKQILTNDVKKKMFVYGKSMLNKNYDVYFSWNDNEIYCSELIWKIYKHGANIELCKLAKLKTFNLNDPKVKLILTERYGNHIPLEETVVAPSQLVESDMVETVIDNY